MAVTKNESFITNSVATSETYNVVSNFTAGRNAIVLVSYYHYAGGPTVTCTIGGDSATLAASAGVGVDRRQNYVFYVRNLTGGSTAVVLAGLIATDNMAITVLELDDTMPVGPVDVSASQDAATASPLTLTTGTTSQANTFAVCVSTALAPGANSSIATPSGYTLGLLNDPGSPFSTSSAYKYQTSIVAESCTWTYSTLTYTGVLVSFKITPSGVATVLMGQACL